MSVPALLERPINADFIAASAVNGQMLGTLGSIATTLHLNDESWQNVFYVLRKQRLDSVCCNFSIATATTLPPLSEMLLPVCVSPARATEQLRDFVGYLAPNLRTKS